MTPTGFPDSAWRSAVMTAEAARIAHQLANAPTGRSIDLPGVTGLFDVPGFVYVNELLGSAESLASHLTSIRPAGFVLVAGGVPGELHAALAAMGWSSRRTLEMMILPREGVPPHRPDGRNVTVELVDAANIRDIRPLSDLAFGLRSHPSAFIGDSRTHGFLARDRSGEVVAMGGWSEAGLGAKVFSIATHPEHRRQGLGTLMTLEAVCSAHRAGARFSYLESTTDGAGIYRRIGFRTLDIWHVFRHPHLRSP
jgi:ribosomal protein S18 acetylase RimI-like enzyme